MKLRRELAAPPSLWFRHRVFEFRGVIIYSRSRIYLSMSVLWLEYEPPSVFTPW